MDFVSNSSVGVFGKYTEFRHITFNVTILDDNIAEPTEELIVTASIFPNQLGRVMFEGGGLTQNITIRIVDDDNGKYNFMQNLCSSPKNLFEHLITQVLFLQHHQQLYQPSLLQVRLRILYCCKVSVPYCALLN